MARLTLSRVGLFAVVAVAFVLGQARTESQVPGAQVFFKGNLHTHTVNSDGDSTPDDVVRWYREHGYNFVTITDHNYLTSVDGLNALHGAENQFIVMKGEELTGRFADKPIHVNGFDPASFIKLPTGTSVVDTLQKMVDGIRDAKAVPSINHPNFGWAFSTDELAQVQRTRLFEVYNGHPTVNNLGGGGVPGLEEVWDRILSSGKLLYGIGVDDAHTFKQPGNPAVPGPGRAWVQVKAARLESRSIVEALERGDFYASTGVELLSIVPSNTSLTVTVKPQGTSKFRIQFIGRQGRVLSEVAANTATYVFKGDESYVRAKVIESNGKAAWVQPVPVGPSAPK